MIINVVLVIVILGSLGYVIALVVRKSPQLANINVKQIPEHQQITIKRQILEEKIKRDFKKRWSAFREVFLAERKKALVGLFSRLYQKLKDLEHEYRVASKKDLSSNVIRSQSVDELITKARKHLEDEEYDRAEQALIDSLKEDEHNIKVFTLLAEVYKAKGDYDHAKETLEFIIHLTNNEDAGVFSDLAKIARERGDLHTAQADYLKSISLDPNNHHHYLELAEVYTILGQHDDARDAAQKSLMLAPNNPKILDFLIENSIILQDKNRANDYLTKLTEANPQNGKIPTFKEKIKSLKK